MSEREREVDRERRGLRVAFAHPENLGSRTRTLSTLGEEDEEESRDNVVGSATRTSLADAEDAKIAASADFEGIAGSLIA